MQENKKLILLFGVTGGTGYHVADFLLANGYPVRVVTRSRASVTKLFKQRQISFQKIIEGQLNDSQILKQAFQPSRSYGRVSVVVSALGVGTRSRDKKVIKQIEYYVPLRIIDKIKQEGNVQKFVYLSGSVIQYPWNPLAAMLNAIVPDIYYWKTQAQNSLRKSGINYVIVRPPILTGDHNQTKVQKYQILQQNIFYNTISRRTVGKVMFDAINAQKIPQKVTFQCGTGTSNLSFESLAPDTSSNILTVNHRTPKYIYAFLLFTFSMIALYYVATKTSQI